MTTKTKKDTKATKAIASVETVEKLGATSNASELFKFQKSANATVAKGFKQYQTVLCAAILHVAKHRDTTVISRVLEQMPDGMRKKSAKDFMQTFGTIVFGEGDSIAIDNAKKLKLGEAMVSPWQSYGGAEEKPFNLDEALASLLKRAKKRMESAKEGDEINPDTIALLSGVVNRTGSKVAA